MIVSSSVSDGYVDMLRDTLRNSPFMQVTMIQPVVEGSASVRTAFEDYEFPDGRTGKWWIENRIKALFDAKGEYWEPLHRNDQFEYVISTLKGMQQGIIARWNANRQIISLFNPTKDLHTSRAPTPPCLISLCFYPVQQALTLIATFRAQYTDAKAYGNLLSLVMLLEKVSKETGFKPLRLYNIAQKTTLKYPKSIGKELLQRLIVTVNRS